MKTDYEKNRLHKITCDVMCSHYVNGPLFVTFTGGSFSKVPAV